MGGTGAITAFHPPEPSGLAIVLGVPMKLGDRLATVRRPKPRLT